MFESRPFDLYHTVGIQIEDLKKKKCLMLLLTSSCGLFLITDTNGSTERRMNIDSLSTASLRCMYLLNGFFDTLQVMFYEALKDLTEYGKQKWRPNSAVNSSLEGLVLGGLAGGMHLDTTSLSTN